jgi:hypothetical protein
MKVQKRVLAVLVVVLMVCNLAFPALAEYPSVLDEPLVQDQPTEDTGEGAGDVSPQLGDALGDDWEDLEPAIEPEDLIEDLDEDLIEPTQRLERAFGLIAPLSVVGALGGVDGVEIALDFTGVKDVYAQYSVGGNWITVNGGALRDNSYSFVIPWDEWINFGAVSVRVVKSGGGMSFTVHGLRDLYEDGETVYIDVPVGTITVTGVSPCNLRLSQDTWVDRAEPADGELQYFVFDNGKDYLLQISKTSFHPISIDGIGANDTVDISEYFYTLEVPEGLGNIGMVSTSWIHGPSGTRMAGGDEILMLKTGRAAELRQAGTNTPIKTFTLDGSNPFLGMVAVAFDGFAGVTVEYQTTSGGPWIICNDNSVRAYEYDNFAIFFPLLGDLGSGESFLFRTTFGDMEYVFETPAELKPLDAVVITVPAHRIIVSGAAPGFRFGLGYGDEGSVYAVRGRGAGATFRVFANGETFLVQVGRDGFTTLGIEVDVAKGGEENHIELDYPVLERTFLHHRDSCRLRKRRNHA